METDAPVGCGGGTFAAADWIRLCAGRMANVRRMVEWRNFRAIRIFKDLILFHEYFHADNGAGLGASHQTGWTALVAKLIQQQGTPSHA